MPIDLRAIFSIQTAVDNIVWSVLIAIAMWIWQKYSLRKIWRGKSLLYWPVTIAVVFVLLSALNRTRSGAADFSRTTITTSTVGSTEQNPNTGLTVLVNLRNIGDASSIDQPHVRVTTVDGERIEGQIQQSLTLIRTDGSQAQIRTSGINPSPVVVRGQMANMSIACMFPRLRPDEVKRAGTVITISFTDAFGRSYEVSQTITALGIPL